MAYNFKNLADVELLNTMPENANILVEVDGATKRAPKENLAAVETLDEVPEGATVLAEVNGEIKRVPGSGLGGGMLYDMPDVVVFTVSSNGSFTCNKTFTEVFNLIKNNELRLTVAAGLAEEYMMMPFFWAMPLDINGDPIFSGDAVCIGFEGFTTDMMLYLLNDDTVSLKNPVALPPN